MLPVINITLITSKFDVQQYFIIFPDLELVIITAHHLA